jgi:hypothetical protein
MEKDSEKTIDFMGNSYTPAELFQMCKDALHSGDYEIYARLENTLGKSNNPDNEQAYQRGSELITIRETEHQRELDSINDFLYNYKDNDLKNTPLPSNYQQPSLFEKSQEPPRKQNKGISSKLEPQEESRIPDVSRRKPQQRTRHSWMSDYDNY